MPSRLNLNLVGVAAALAASAPIVGTEERVEHLQEGDSRIVRTGNRKERRKAAALARRAARKPARILGLRK